jgi:UDP:flavonoid glycosyltransferase YjiC (YdhE family)
VARGEGLHWLRGGRLTVEVSIVLVVGRPHAPDPGDLAPLIGTLVTRGHQVVLLATEEHRDVAVQTGVGFRLLPPLPVKPLRQRLSKIAQAREVFRSLLIDSLAAHWETVERVVEQERPDVVLADALCFAACMLAEYPRTDRPPVVVLGTIPPPHAHPHSAPYGLGMQPDESPVNRLRNRILHLFVRRVILRPVLPELHDLFYELTGRVMSRDSYEAAGKAEVWAQCEPDRFEYPHTAAAANLKLVGALSIAPAVELPQWWDEAHRRPLVHVRATQDVPLQRLVVPLIEALEGSGQNLVITGARAESVVAALGCELPEGTYVAEEVPASRVISHTGVAVIKGYFVHAQHALQQGLPVVSFGSGAEERETGARLDWNRCGIHLPSDHPTAAELRDAVHRVLADPGYRQAAARIAAQAAGTNAEDTIANMVEALVTIAGTQGPAESADRLHSMGEL